MCRIHAAQRFEQVVLRGRVILQELPSGARERCTCFNAFLYTKLVEDNGSSGSTPARPADGALPAAAVRAHARVQRWLKVCLVSACGPLWPRSLSCMRH